MQQITIEFNKYYEPSYEESNTAIILKERMVKYKDKPSLITRLDEKTKDIILKETDFLPEDSLMIERIYNILHPRIREDLKCKNNKYPKFDNLKTGYKQFCSLKCKCKSENISNKQKEYHSGMTQEKRDKTTESLRNTLSKNNPNYKIPELKESVVDRKIKNSSIDSIKSIDTNEVIKLSSFYDSFFNKSFVQEDTVIKYIKYILVKYNENISAIPKAINDGIVTIIFNKTSDLPEETKLLERMYCLLYPNDREKYKNSSGYYKKFVSFKTGYEG